MRRIGEDMDQLFANFFGRDPFEALGLTGTTTWPEVEVYRHENKLVVRADVPGLNREDVNVEVSDNELRVSGERRHESEQREREYYRSERTYGSFSRTIPLPEGAKTDTASATFHNGVLQIEIEVPVQTSRSRKIDVREQASH